MLQISALPWLGSFFAILWQLRKYFLVYLPSIILLFVFTSIKSCYLHSKLSSYFKIISLDTVTVLFAIVLQRKLSFLYFSFLQHLFVVFNLKKNISALVLPAEEWTCPLSDCEKSVLLPKTTKIIIGLVTLAYFLFESVDCCWLWIRMIYHAYFI